MVDNSTNIKKPKECFDSDGRQFYQYQQTNRKFKQWWSIILQISTKQKKVLTVMVNNFTNINKTKERFNIDGHKFLQYQQTKRKFEQWWSTILPISTKQKKVLTVMVNNFLISTKQKKVLSLMVTNSSNINKPKGSLSNRDGKQFLQYQQNKRKFIKQRWSTILPISTNQKKV